MRCHFFQPRFSIESLEKDWGVFSSYVDYLRWASTRERQPPGLPEQFVGRAATNLPRGHYRLTALATTANRTDAAPAFNKTFVDSFAVAPVVRTSSTNKMC